MIFVIEAGCAECWGGDKEPLISAHRFDSAPDAKKWASEQRWVADSTGYVHWSPHPLGGEHVVVGQGSLWLLPEAQV